MDCILACENIFICDHLYLPKCGSDNARDNKDLTEFAHCNFQQQEQQQLQQVIKTAC